MISGTNWTRHADQLGDKASDRLLERWMMTIAAQMPDVWMERSKERVEIKGRGLIRRWLGDSALRFLPGLDR